MSHAVDSKSAAAVLIDPLSAPEPSAADGPGSHFGSTFAPKSEINGTTSPIQSNNPYRNSSSPKQSPLSPATKTGITSSVRSSSGSSRSARFPEYRAEALSDFDPAPRRRAGSQSHTPPSYQEATSSSQPGRRRGSSLKERYPGDESTQPLDIIRRDSRKAYRSHHLKKKSLPGADSIDRLDPAIGGLAYHHEGPYDAALMARNRDPKTAPLAALKDSNAEAIKATPKENIKDAVERHKPLDGVAIVPPGTPDAFGRTYKYEEGTDLMLEGTSDAGYKRWPGKDYDPEDLKGESEPAFSLDRALRAHKISDNGIELQDRSHLNQDYHDAERRGDLDSRDPMTIAGGEGKYVDMEIANTTTSDVKRSSLGGSLKKRVGSLRRKLRDE